MQDKELADFQQKMKAEEMEVERRALEDELYRMQVAAGLIKTRNEALADDEVEPEEREDIAEVIADNKFLLGRVDMLLKQNQNVTVGDGDPYQSTLD